jgi:hypothetical protein
MEDAYKSSCRCSRHSKLCVGFFQPRKLGNPQNFTRLSVVPELMQRMEADVLTGAAPMPSAILNQSSPCRPMVLDERNYSSDV